MSVTTDKNGNVEQITIRNHRTDHLLNEVQDAVIKGFVFNKELFVKGVMRFS